MLRTPCRTALGFGGTAMIDSTTPVATAPSRASRRRLAMLASTATVGLAVVLAGPGVYRQAVSTPALATETTVRAPGFADVVAKVKPAVISVRVKLDQAQVSFNGTDELVPGMPMEKFFRR